MKNLKKIRLDALSEASMSDPQMRKISGGYFCVCGACGRYEGETKDEAVNQDANSADDLKTDGKCTAWWHYNTL